jgi:hypothetical protein
MKNDKTKIELFFIFTWIVPTGPAKGASVALASGGDPAELWGSSLRLWSGESPSLLLSSPKANASAALEKLTWLPEGEKPNIHQWRRGIR